jgi:hypothetical protein
VSHEARLVQALQQLYERGQKGTGLGNGRERFEVQRFQMSENKERDLFLLGVFGRIERMQERRMSNQEALPISLMRNTVVV